MNKKINLNITEEKYAQELTELNDLWSDLEDKRDKVRKTQDRYEKKRIKLEGWKQVIVGEGAVAPDDTMVGLPSNIPYTPHNHLVLTWPQEAEATGSLT
jgi:hypothetical protein